jgi:hypothetical protein
MRRCLSIAAVCCLLAAAGALWASCNTMSGYRSARPDFLFYRPSAAEIAAAREQARQARIARTKARIGAMADLKAQADANAIEARRDRLENQFNRAYDMTPEQREKIARELYERGKRSEGGRNYEAAKDYYLFTMQIAPGTTVSRLAHDGLLRIDALEAKTGNAPRAQGGPGKTLLTQEELKELENRLQQAAGSDPETDDEIQLLLEQLNDFPDERSQRLVIDRLRDQPGKPYSEALVQAIRLTTGDAQDYARAALAERFKGLSENVLLSKLRSGDEETQLAAAKAAGSKSAALAEDLVELLDKSERVSQAARQSLRTLTGDDFGPQPGARADERFAAKQRWKRKAQGK